MQHVAPSFTGTSLLPSTTGLLSLHKVCMIPALLPEGLSSAIQCWHQHLAQQHTQPTALLPQSCCTMDAIPTQQSNTAQDFHMPAPKMGFRPALDIHHSYPLPQSCPAEPSLPNRLSLRHSQQTVHHFCYAPQPPALIYKPNTRFPSCQHEKAIRATEKRSTLACLTYERG